MLCSFNFASAYDFEVDNVYYTVLSVPELTVEVAPSPNKYKGIVTIPQTVEWSGRCFNIISIESKAFYDCSELKEIYIPRSIKTVNSDAFSKTNLEKVHLEDVKSWLSVTLEYFGFSLGETIKSSPFNNGASLCIDGELIENLIIPEGIKTLNGNFSGCGSIRKVTLPESCCCLNGSFAQCKNLETVDPKGANITIGAYTFSGCDKVNLDFLDKCIELSNYAFASCGLSKIVIPSSITKIGFGLFSNCPNLEHCVIGNGISELPYKQDETFNRPAGMNMFDGCKNLKYIEIEDSEFPLNVNYCGYNKYLDVDGDRNIFSRYWGAFSRFNLESISIYRDLSYPKIRYEYSTCFHVYAPFAGNKSLKKAYIGGSATSIGNCYFENCNSLESVTLGKNVKSISTSFSTCNNLKQIKLESSIPPILSGEFSHSQLLSVKIIVPDGCVSTYMQSDGWKEFLNILDESSAGFNDITIADIHFISVSYDGIIYQGEHSTSLIIYGIDGICQYSGNVSPGQHITLPKGIYIVKLDNRSIKVKI